jgi:mannose-6-phosphate isomerase-like protein (cupin superfamily)
MSRAQLNVSIAIVCFGAFAQVNAADAPSAPASGSPGIYVDHSTIEAKLKDAIQAAKDPAVSPMAITDQYLVNKVRRNKVGPPAIHPGWTELHIVLDGSATFVTGGKIVTDAQGKPGSIDGGVSQKVSKGDAVVVPANSPHWYKQIDGEITVIEVRFMAPAAP